MLELQRTPNNYELVVSKIVRLVKTHNPSSLFNFTTNDIVDTAKDIQADYDILIVEDAARDIAANHANSELTIGKFMEKCAELKKSARNLQETQTLINPIRKRSMEIKNEHMAKIRACLAKATHKLPYDKTHRVKNGNETLRDAPSKPTKPFGIDEFIIPNMGEQRSNSPN